MRKLWPVLALGLIVAAFSQAAAEVSLKEVRWGFRQVSKMHIRAGAFQESAEWTQPPTNRVVNLPRAAVTLVNQSSTPAEGVVLRYAITARIVSVKNPGSDGTWVVPFWVDRRRVPFLKPNQTLEVQINPADEMRLTTSLREMFRAGFWPKALKMEVVVEPHLGEDAAQPISEKTLSVIWQPAKK